MINREATIRWKGYDPNELSHGSNKRVWAVCDGCGRGRWVIFQNYSDLCGICTRIKLVQSDEHRTKNSEWHRGRRYSDEHCRNIAEAKKGDKNPVKNPEVKKKISESRRGKARGDDNSSKRPDVRQKISDVKTIYWDDINNRIKLSCIQQGIEYDDWNGFTSDKKYCFKFGEQLKRYIREKHNHCDYISGLHKDVCNKGRELHVHHVDYDKEQGCSSEKWKLIPLSASNHGKTNANRSFWNRLFTYSIQYDENYYKDFDIKELLQQSIDCIN